MLKFPEILIDNKAIKIEQMNLKNILNNSTKKN